MRVLPPFHTCTPVVHIPESFPDCPDDEAILESSSGELEFHFLKLNPPRIHQDTSTDTSLNGRILQSLNQLVTDEVKTRGEQIVSEVLDY